MKNSNLIANSKIISPAIVTQEGNITRIFESDNSVFMMN